MFISVAVPFWSFYYLLN